MAGVREEVDVPIPDSPVLQLPRGAFVTLRHGPELRGCIGHIMADRPLAEVVARMAVSAALDAAADANDDSVSNAAIPCATVTIPDSFRSDACC